MVAQCLCGHHATGAYLHRFGHPEEEAWCRWCEDAEDTILHRVLDCPRHEDIRQELRAEVEDEAAGRGQRRGAETEDAPAPAWGWEYLATRGRSQLARFLVRISSRYRGSDWGSGDGSD